MALTALDCTTQYTKLADIKAAFIAAGIVDTEHYYSGEYYIVTTTMFSFVIKIQCSNALQRRIYIWIGTGYDSGTNITNQTVINVFQNNNCQSDSAVIITSDIIAIVDRRDGLYLFSTIFAKVAITGEELALGMAAMASGDSQLNCHNFTDGERVWVLTPDRAIISAAGKYYTVTPIVVSAGYKLLGEGIDGLTVLARPVSSAAAYEVAGNDVAIQGGGSNQISNCFPLGWLIEDGNI